jgi:hypothetical protein
MSLDLLEAFGLEDADSSGAKNPKSESKQAQLALFADVGSFSAIDKTPTNSPAPQLTAPEDDDWGDFEDAMGAGGDSLGLGHKKNALSMSTRYKYDLDELGAATAPAAPPRRQEIDLLNKEFASTTISTAATRHIPTGNSAKVNRDSDVLFDASDDEGEDDGEDDFGDFEDSIPVVEPQQNQVEIDLLGLDEPLNDAKPIHNDIKLDPALPAQHDTFTESWDDFGPTDYNADDNAESVKPMINYSNIKGSADPVGSGQALSGISIPPPSVLLSTFVPIVETVERELAQPLASCETAIRQQILSDPKTTEYIRGYLLVMTVCGHIVGGRKLRWKRDTVLGQSMKIGPAGSGRSGGMKLTTVDKTEVTKEDGEVAEVLRAWNRQVGKIKSIVVEAKKASNTEVGAVPELRDTMAVKATKQSEGGIPSRKPCLLCGLKREERVDKVGVDIQDSFGEWWVEAANMHRCITPTLINNKKADVEQFAGISGSNTNRK